MARSLQYLDNGSVADTGVLQRMPVSIEEEARPTNVWGLPLAPITLPQTLERIDQLIHSGEFHYVITANVHYAQLCEQDRSLAAVNAGAALVTADGMPLVWASRLHRRRFRSASQVQICSQPCVVWRQTGVIGSSFSAGRQASARRPPVVCKRGIRDCRWWASNRHLFALSPSMKKRRRSSAFAPHAPIFCSCPSASRAGSAGWPTTCKR